MKKIIIILLCLLTTGCYDYKELNNITIIDSIRIDYDNESYKVCFKDIDNNNYCDSNSNLYESFNNNYFLKHVNTVYLSDSVCRNGINDLLNYFMRNINFSNSYKIVISNNDDNNNSIIEGLDNIKLLSYLYKGDKDIGLINVDNNLLGYFKDDKLINYIDSNIYMFINFNKHIEFSDNDNNVIKIYDRDVSYKNNILRIDCYGEIVSTNYNIINYNELSDKFIKIIEDNIKSYIDIVYEDNCNIFGIDKNYSLEINLTLNKNGNLIEGL